MICLSQLFQIEAVAYDNPIPGYGTRNTITLRLWAAKPSNQHDMVVAEYQYTIEITPMHIYNHMYEKHIILHCITKI